MTTRNKISFVIEKRKKEKYENSHRIHSSSSSRLRHFSHTRKNTRHNCDLLPAWRTCDVDRAVAFASVKPDSTKLLSIRDHDSNFPQFNIPSLISRHRHCLFLFLFSLSSATRFLRDKLQVYKKRCAVDENDSRSS